MTIQTMQDIARRLTAAGFPATVEYPGFIDVRLTDGTGHSYAFGDANASRPDELGCNRTGMDGDAVPDPLGLDVATFTGSPRELAAEIAAELREAATYTIGVRAYLGGALGASGDSFLCCACARTLTADCTDRTPMTRDHVFTMESEGTDGDVITCHICNARLLEEGGRP